MRSELAHPEAPGEVRRWLSQAPSWLMAHTTPVTYAAIDAVEPDLQRLDQGEREAIVLAVASAADLILMDDWAGVVVARARGFAVTGTLGLIDLAARRGLIDVAKAVARLQATSFRCRPDLLRELLTRHDTG